jgi:hypothetical protein
VLHSQTVRVPWRTTVIHQSLIIASGALGRRFSKTQLIFLFGFLGLVLAACSLTVLVPALIFFPITFLFLLVSRRLGF